MAIETFIPPTQAPPSFKPFDSDPRYVWLTPRQIQERFGLSKSYLYDFRDSPFGLPFAPTGGRKILYRLDLFHEWLEQHLVKGFHDPKYRAILKQHREAKQKKREKLAASSRKSPEKAFTPGIPIFQSPVSPSGSGRPQSFRPYPVAGDPQKRLTAAEAARTRLLFRFAM